MKPEQKSEFLKKLEAAVDADDLETEASEVGTTMAAMSPEANQVTSRMEALGAQKFVDKYSFLAGGKIVGVGAALEGEDGKPGATNGGLHLGLMVDLPDLGRGVILIIKDFNILPGKTSKEYEEEAKAKSKGN